MECNNCPYNSDNFERTYLWCDKIGGKTYGLTCYENNDRYDNKKTISYVKRNKRERYKKHQEKLIKLDRKISKYRYYPPVYYVDRYWVDGYGLVNNIRPYYRRQYKGKRHTALKKQSNKIVRRYKGILNNGNLYRHLYNV